MTEEEAKTKQADVLAAFLQNGWTPPVDERVVCIGEINPDHAVVVTTCAVYSIKRPYYGVETLEYEIRLECHL